MRLTSRRRRGAGSAILGSASFTIKGGATADVSVALGRTGLHLLRGAARNSVQVRVAPRAGAMGKPVQGSLTLTR